MTSTIAHVTDIHLDEPFPLEKGVDPKANWEMILEDLKNRQIKRVIFGGDIGASSALDYFFKSMKGFELSIAPGNHDRDQKGKAHLEDLEHKDGHYSYRDEACYRYISMDTSTEEVSDQQMEWLASSLETDLKIILAVHHPILPVPSYIDSRYALKGREAIQKILHRVEKEVTIVCGHYHLEDERSAGNIRQLLTPAASYLLEKSETLTFRPGLFGYRILEISPHSIETNVIYLKPKA